MKTLTVTKTRLMGHKTTEISNMKTLTVIKIRLMGHKTNRD